MKPPVALFKKKSMSKRYYILLELYYQHSWMLFAQEKGVKKTVKKKVRVF